MDWSAFFEGYAAGTAQMVCIDLVILIIIWPLRSFIAILKDPEVKRRIRVLVGMED